MDDRKQTPTKLQPICQHDQRTEAHMVRPHEKGQTPSSKAIFEGCTESTRKRGNPEESERMTSNGQK